jgi:branched-subunit amino acid transport protein
MNPWLVVVAAGVASYLLRISMVAVGGKAGIPPVLERATRFAVPAAFAALAATALAPLAAAGGDAVAPAVAIVAAVIAVRRTGNATTALVVGMPVLWLVSALPG